MEWEELRKLTVDEIGARMSGVQHGSLVQGQLMDELARRRLIEQMEATIAQKRAATALIDAATAGVDTAKATKANARYMLLSVIALSVFSILNLLVSIYAAAIHKG
jgi:hypothetical protein